ncbi:MAG: DUF2207 domain-containing protein, partial [Acidimicrobiia bacterium]|nr:DUF2207 domain-containing protein [Acidimicrobiia bacterium]
MKRVVAACFAAFLFVGLALPAQAKSYWLDHADVDVTINPDGSLLVVETLTFDFSGQFSGAYRDIPLGSGVSIGNITVGD